MLFPRRLTSLKVNGHVESDYDAVKNSWSDPCFVADPYLRIHGLAPGLNYGQQVFEGLKGIFLDELEGKDWI
jgi:branched-chain amino acid aminotransferase